MSPVKTISPLRSHWLIRLSGISLFILTFAGVFLSSPASSHDNDSTESTHSTVSTPLSNSTVSTVSINNSAPSKSLSEPDIERARNYFTDTELTTHEGNKVRFYTDVLDGRIVMINVMYTSCKGSCPLLTQKLSQVSRELGDLYGKSIHFVSITNDAERDTPEALSKFAIKQGVNLDGWTFLTGPKAKVDSVIKKIGLYTPKFEQHKAMILLGNTGTGHWQKVQPNVPYQAVAVKLKELAGGA